jgi:hypothetical protein
MTFDEAFENCVSIFKHGHLNGDNAQVVDFTWQNLEMVVVNSKIVDNTPAVRCADTFTAVEWFLKIEKDVYSPGKMDDLIIVPNDEEIMQEQDRQRLAGYKFKYPWLEVRYAK